MGEVGRSKGESFDAGVSFSSVPAAEEAGGEPGPGAFDLGNLSGVRVEVRDEEREGNCDVDVEWVREEEAE